MWNHPAAAPNDELLADCDVRRQRRSGPGGQHRNKVETSVVITHRPTGQSGQAAERRSQEQNRRMAVFRLRVSLALHVRGPIGDVANFSPTDRWQSRIVAGRIEINPSHDDFPSLLAEALDVAEACEFDLKPAAETFGISTSQLVRFVRLEPQAIGHINAERIKRDMRPLR